MIKQKSFTLIELLVVIVIIGILAGVIMISTSSSIDKASFAKAQAFSSTVQNELLSNLVSEWTFDNPSSIGEDTWGNKDMIIYGNTFYETNNCFSQGCLSFNTMDDYATSSLVYNNLHSFTLTAWINP
ncbi:MAG: type II secretion system protein [Candidatus Pacebacteria bacterium]|nr:type II secretion system protein [Candidatus Paceibacterota bacterium]